MALGEKFQEYCDQTPIHGFGFIPKSFLLPFKVLWLVIVLVGLGLSINDLIIQVVLYQSIPTMVNVEAHRETDISRPVPVFCVELNNFFLPPPDKNGGNTTISQFVPQLLSWTKNLTEFPTSSSYMNVYQYLPYDLFYYTYTMLGYMSSFQLLMSQHDYESIYFDLFDFVQKPATYMKQDGDFVETLYQTYKSQGVSFERLTMLIGSVLCNNYLITTDPNLSFVSINNKRFPITMCSAESITHLSFGLLCMRVANDTVWSTPNFDLSMGSLFIGLMPGIAGIYPMLPQTPDIYRWHLDFQGRTIHCSSDRLNVHSFGVPYTPKYFETPTVDPLSDVVNRSAYFNSEETVFNTYFGTIVVLSVQLRSYYNFYNKVTKPCTNANEKYNSLLEQRAEYFFHKCGCWPESLYVRKNDISHGKIPCSAVLAAVRPTENTTALNELMNNNVNGTWTVNMPVWDAVAQHNQYNNILTGKTILSGRSLVTNVNQPSYYSLFKNCSNEQFSPVAECEVVHFDVTETSMRHLSSGGSFLLIQMRSDLYSSITETPYKTWNTFVSEFGGSIGVWLGGSLIAFLHIPLFIGGALLQRCTKKRSARESHPLAVETPIVPDAIYEKNMSTSRPICL